MPTYEMPLLLRVMSQGEIASTLKRAAETIFKQGGFIRKIDNCGQKPLPCKTSAHGAVHKEANVFFIYFEAPTKSLRQIIEDNKHDVDIVRCRIFKQNEPTEEECTFHEDLLPPAYRPEVQEMLKIMKKNEEKKEFKHNSGLSYYPFMK